MPKIRLLRIITEPDHRFSEFCFQLRSIFDPSQWISDCSVQQNHLQDVWRRPRCSDSEGLGWGLRISSGFPGDADAGSGRVLWKPLYYVIANFLTLYDLVGISSSMHDQKLWYTTHYHGLFIFWNFMINHLDVAKKMDTCISISWLLLFFLSLMLCFYVGSFLSFFIFFVLLTVIFLEKLCLLYCFFPHVL